MSLLEKMRGDKKGWYKVSDLAVGAEIAVPSQTGEMIWDEIVSIKPVGREQVYDIEVEGTHNFIGNDIFAHNTYILKANTMLAVTGEVNANEFIVPVPTLLTGTASSTLFAEIPPEVLTADGTGVDLFKLATYNLAIEKLLDVKVDGQGVRITALEDRVTKLETGAVGVATGSPISLSTTSLASVFEGLSAYIGKGFAQFGSLIADRFVAAANSAGTSSAGTVNLLTGNTVAQVTNAYVTPATKIFVTFNAPVTGSWYVSDKQAGSFSVVLSVAQTTDVSFDYFLVQTEGQTATSTPDGTQNSNSNQNSQGQTSNSDTVAPVITLLGDNPLHLSVGGTFAEPGVTVLDNVDGDLTAKIVETGTVDTATIGSYTITYTATDKALNTSIATRTVIVGVSTGGSGDTTKPVVTLTGSVTPTVVQGSSYTDAGATAVDDIDGPITPVASGTVDTTTIGTYTITYTATDKAGNIGTVSRLVTVAAAAGDTTKPVITLNGAAPMSLTVGDTFTDPGATATDDTDGDLTAKIVKTGSVDTATAGSYSITYSATDKAGNTGSASRTVTVVAAPAAAATGG